MADCAAGLEQLARCDCPYEEDRNGAIDLYGVALCKFLVGQRDRLEPTGKRV